MPHSEAEQLNLLTGNVTVDNHQRVVSNIIDCPEILERLNFRTNQSNSRDSSLFYLSTISSIYMLYIIDNVFMSLGNSLEDLDLFKITLFNLSIFSSN
jgi:hypothetical protein